LELLAIGTLDRHRERVGARSPRRSQALQRLGSAVVMAVALLAGAAALSLQPAAAEVERDAPELEALAQRLAAMPGLSARFEEEKRLSLLRAPLKSEGTLYYARPDRIARRVEQPTASTWVLRGDQLFLSGPDGVHSMDLTTQPALRPLIEALRLVFTGDLVALRDRFEVDFDASTSPAGTWRLQLVPRPGPLRELVTAIEVTGVDGILSTLRVLEVGGDETVNRFSDVDPARHFSEIELERLFDAALP
jgi:hypothetical protein